MISPFTMCKNVPISITINGDIIMGMLIGTFLHTVNGDIRHVADFWYLKSLMFIFTLCIIVQCEIKRIIQKHSVNNQNLKYMLSCFP